MDKEEKGTQQGQGADAQQVAQTLSKLDGALTAYINQRRREATWNRIKRAGIVSLVAGVGIFYIAMYARAFGFQLDPAEKAIAMVPIQGTIAQGLDASADRVVPILERACKAKNVEAVALDINSGGGQPAEAERIIAAVERCQAGGNGQEGKKVYALINGVGASAAYMIAMKTDRVYAGRYSLVGSVGAIMRINDASELAGRIGVREVAFRTSPLKGGPSMISGLTQEDRDELQTLVQDMGHVFRDEVVAARGEKLTRPIEEIYSGRVWTAEEALDIGLVDELAVLEGLKGTLFADRAIHRYSTKKPLVEAMGLKDLVHQAVADMAAMRIE